MLKKAPYYTHGLIHHPHEKVDLFWGEGFCWGGVWVGGVFQAN